MEQGVVLGATTNQFPVVSVGFPCVWISKDAGHAR
jgi:hypothetical protein